MTVQYPETGARPLPYGAAPRETASETYEPATYDSLDGEETFHNTPVYARRPTKKGGVPKMALMAIPVVLALGVGAWALTAGESSREQAPAEDTDSLTTSRLSDVPAPASPEVAAPAVTEAAPAAPVAAAPAIAPAARPAAPAARAATPPARASQAPRRAAPARPSTPTLVLRESSAPQPYSSGGLQTVITEPGPVAAPPAVSPTPTLPVEPTPQETPPATTTPPGGQA